MKKEFEHFPIFTCLPGYYVSYINSNSGSDNWYTVQQYSSTAWELLIEEKWENYCQKKFEQAMHNKRVLVSLKEKLRSEIVAVFQEKSNLTWHWWIIELKVELNLNNYATVTFYVIS